MNYSRSRRQSPCLSQINRHAAKAVTVYLLCLVLGTSGCATAMHEVPFDALGGVASNIAVGDTVRVLAKDGDRQTFKVTDISLTTLSGEDVEFAFSDIELIEKRNSAAGGWGTTAVIVTLAVVGLVAIAASEASKGVSFGLGSK